MVTIVIFSFVGIVLLLVSFVRPFTGIIILVWTLILSEIVTIEIGPLTLNRILGLVILGGLFLYQRRGGKMNQAGFTKFDHYVLAYITVILISVIVNRTTLNLDGRFRNVIMGYLFYFLITNLVNSWERLRSVFWNIIVASLVVAGGIYYELITIPSIERKLRIGGALSSVHLSAQFIMIAMILCIWAIESRKKEGIVRYISYTLLAIFAGALLMTGSRTEIGVVFISVIALSFMTEKFVSAIKRVAILGVLSLVIAVVLAPISPYAINRVLGLIPGYSLVFDVPSQYRNAYELLARGQTTRKELDDAALQIFNDNPIFGAGYDSFAKINSQYVYLSVRQHQSSGHNVFFVTLAETGLFGVIFLVGMYMEVLLPLWRSRNFPSPNASVVKYMSVMIVGLNVIIASLLADDIERHMYLLFALGVVTTRLLQEDQLKGTSCLGVS